MSKKDDRIRKLVDTLQQRQGMTIRELSVLFDVSEMTIRRDLELLKQDNLILDIPGAAIYNTNCVNSDHYSIKAASDTRAAEKERIGQKAASLIEENDCVIIDNGTTTEWMAACISPAVSATILTSNLNIVNELATKPDIKIICGGGYYHADTGLFESQESISLIQKSRATKVFCSAAGIHDAMGVTCMNSYEVATKRAIMASGAKKILLADSSKFGVVKSCYVTNLSSFDLIISDNELSEEWRNIITENQVALITV